MNFLKTLDHANYICNDLSPTEHFTRFWIGNIPEFTTATMINDNMDDELGESCEAFEYNNLNTQQIQHFNHQSSQMALQKLMDFPDSDYHTTVQCQRGPTRRFAGLCGSGKGPSIKVRQYRDFQTPPPWLP